MIAICGDGEIFLVKTVKVGHPFSCAEIDREKLIEWLRSAPPQKS
jgi:hypothetical protein